MWSGRGCGRWGDDFTPAQLTTTRELFVPRALQPAQVKAAVTRDLAYGPDARHRLDVFAPAEAGAGRQVVVYVHGGGFVQGDKGGEGAPFFNNVGAWAVRSGSIGKTLSRVHLRYLCAGAVSARSRISCLLRKRPESGLCALHGSRSGRVTHTERFHHQ